MMSLIFNMPIASAACNGHSYAPRLMLRTCEPYCLSLAATLNSQISTLLIAIIMQAAVKIIELNERSHVVAAILGTILNISVCPGVTTLHLPAAQ